MQRQYEIFQQQNSASHIHPSTKQSRMTGLQSRMTLSYVWVTIIIVLVLELLAMLGLSFILFQVITPYVYTLEAKQIAQRYALIASLQTKTATLNPQSTFREGQAGTLKLPKKSSSSDAVPVPYITTQIGSTQAIAIALLIASDGSIFASSYPQRYPIHTTVSSIIPDKAPLINRAFIGIDSSGSETTFSETSVYAVETVWDRQMHPVGAIYVKITNLPSVRDMFTSAATWLRLFLIGGAILLIVLTPMGGFFGILTMRGVIKRIHLLVNATSSFANGDYAQRVSIGRADEIGKLEHHFNLMALQLTENIRQQQALTEQNVRLAERARMSRDLHDSVKQQVFALATQIGAALSLFDQKREDTRTHLKIANELAYQVRQELTALIQELRPSLLGEKGFNQALQDELERWSRQNNIPVDIQLQAVPQFPSAIAKQILLVVQEALSNISRHSEASAVLCVLEQEQEQIVLTIADNGHSFDSMTVSSESMGLQSMRERIEEIGGTFLLQNILSQGTRITIYYPHSLHTIASSQSRDA